LTSCSKLFHFVNANSYFVKHAPLKYLNKQNIGRSFINWGSCTNSLTRPMGLDRCLGKHKTTLPPLCKNQGSNIRSWRTKYLGQNSEIEIYVL